MARRRTEEELQAAAAIDMRRAKRAAVRTGRKQTERMAALRAIEPGSSADFEVADAFEAASLRGSAYSAIGRGECWCEQVSHRTVRVYRHVLEAEAS